MCVVEPKKWMEEGSMVVERLVSPFAADERAAMREFSVRAEYSGIGETVGEFWLSLDAIVQTEIEYRRNRLATSLKKEKAKEKHSMKEKKFHEKSLKRIDKTIRALRKERKKLDRKKLEEKNKHFRDNVTFRKFQTKTMETLNNEFLESYIDPDIALEVSGIFDDVFSRINKDKGVVGILDLIEEQLEDLKKVRTKPSRGREHGSPLPWWKIGALIALGGVVAWLVWHCPMSDAAFVACVAAFICGQSKLIATVKAIIAWC
jgi:hypothetical protein